MSLALLAAASALATGCVERRITIYSNPDGALVQLNDVEIGRTPITVPFTWYGDYDIVLRYEREVETPDGPVRKVFYKHTHERTHAPPHQWIGVDLFTELLPAKFEDHKTWAFVLDPLPELSDEEVVDRAKELKTHLDKPVEFTKEKKKGNTLIPPATPASAPATPPAPGPATTQASKPK